MKKNLKFFFKNLTKIDQKLLIFCVYLTAKKLKKWPKFFQIFFEFEYPNLQFWGSWCQKKMFETPNWKTRPNSKFRKNWYFLCVVARKAIFGQTEAIRKTRDFESESSSGTHSTALGVLFLLVQTDRKSVHTPPKSSPVKLDIFSLPPIREQGRKKDVFKQNFETIFLPQISISRPFLS